MRAGAIRSLPDLYDGRGGFWGFPGQYEWFAGI